MKDRSTKEMSDEINRALLKTLLRFPDMPYPEELIWGNESKFEFRVDNMTNDEVIAELEKIKAEKKDDWFKALRTLMYRLATHDENNFATQIDQRRKNDKRIVKRVSDILFNAELILDAFISYLRFGEPEIYGSKSTSYFFSMVSEGLSAVQTKINEEEKEEEILGRH